MPRIRKEDTGNFLQHYPKLATVVTVKAKERENAVAWHCSLSYKPPLYGVAISSKRFSYGLILEAKEFAGNFLPIESRKLIAAVGRTSGREFDKFEKLHIAKEEPLKIGAPDIAPAKRLGLKTIRLMVWPFALQEARTPEEQPDVTIEKLSELPKAIEELSRG